MQIAFYAPMKPPDHAVPSGDRKMANLLLAALAHAGYHATIASRLRGYTRTPDMRGLQLSADAEIERLMATWGKRQAPERPDIWFTYHPYYKAPDLIGPVVARHLKIPYVTAEASYSARRQAGEWQCMQTSVVAAVRQASMNFCLTPIDRQGLAQITSEEQLTDLPPFIDACEFNGYHVARRPGGPCRLVTVAMMRPGVKLESYAMIASALQLVRSEDWQLTIIGDGPARANVEELFNSLPADRVRFVGEQRQCEVCEELWRSDLFVWPGFGEAYGLAYLEAQACGVPVIAQNIAGVPSVVSNGTSGLLTPLGDVAAFASALDRLIGNDTVRSSMSEKSSQFVRTERTIAHAAQVLDYGLRRALNRFGQKSLVS